MTVTNRKLPSAADLDALIRLNAKVRSTRAGYTADFKSLTDEGEGS